MKTSNDSDLTSSSSLYHISLSASLPSLTSASSSLSGFSSSSSHYSEGGLLSVSTTFSSIQDLQAVGAAHENYPPWDEQEEDEHILPFAYDVPRGAVAPFLTRLKRSLAHRRAHLLRHATSLSTWDLCVAAVFCFYLWVLLSALAGNRNDEVGSLCQAGLLANSSIGSSPHLKHTSLSALP